MKIIQMYLGSKTLYVRISRYWSMPYFQKGIFMKQFGIGFIHFILWKT